MNGPADLARGWLQKADSDLTTAELVLSGDGPYDTACYHAQQAIEKCLKTARNVRSRAASVLPANARPEQALE